MVLNEGEKKSRGEGSQKQPGTLSELTGFSNLAGQKKVYQKISLKKALLIWNSSQCVEKKV